MKVFSIEQLHKMHDDELEVVAAGCISLLLFAKVRAKTIKVLRNIAALEDLKENIEHVKSLRKI